MSSKPTVLIFNNQEMLAQAAAELIVEAADEALVARGRFRLALSGGSTPEPVFKLLASGEYRQRLNWAASELFWADERCVPPGEPGSNYGQAKRLLLDYVNVPTGQIQRIRGELAPEEAAADYRERLASMATGGCEWPILDLVLLGMGADGHTASLFPGARSPEEDKLAAIPVTANYDGRPAQRVSLTPPVFNSARYVLFLVTGAAKAEAVAAVLAGSADGEKWPAARIQPASGRLAFYLDEAATAAMT